MIVNIPFHFNLLKIIKENKRYVIHSVDIKLKLKLKNIIIQKHDAVPLDFPEIKERNIYIHFDTFYFFVHNFNYPNVLLYIK